MTHAAARRRATAISAAEIAAMRGIKGALDGTMDNGNFVVTYESIIPNLQTLRNYKPQDGVPQFLFLHLMSAHPLGLRTATGLAIGFIGTALIAWPQEGAAANFALGAGTIAVLFACFNWAVATTYLRNIDTTLDVMTFTGLQMIIGGVMMMTLGFALNEAPAWNWNPLGLAMLAYMTLFSSCLAYTAYGWLSVNMTPAQVSTYAFVNPAVATLLGWWVLDEHLNVAQSLGMAVILGAMLLVNWPAARDTAQ
ncbi:MAG: hypothetical protein EBR15_00765 [Gammaproteobacteria bacterium]|nr:hypothetical protein [Gammaproteobacteria bacterium]